MHYEIAIASYKRERVLREATLDTLIRNDIDLDRVTVWCADEEQVEAYRLELGDVVQIKPAVIGAFQAKRFYHRQYAEGTPLVGLDDDVYDVQQKNGDHLQPMQQSLNTIIEDGFRLCEKTGARLWGMNPVSNGWYLRDEVTVGLRYIIGAFHGTYAGNDAVLGQRATEGLHSGADDHETTCRSFLRYGAVIRFEHITPITKYFAPGGIQSRVDDLGLDRKETHAEALSLVAHAYPDIASFYWKANSVPNLRLKPITHAKIPVSAL